MSKISASLVKELREKTGAGMLDCRNALQETDGDLDKAVDLLREKDSAKLQRNLQESQLKVLLKLIFTAAESGF